MINDSRTRIVLTGGGTLGSVTPLLAIADELLALDNDQFSLMWIGTSLGVERNMTSDYPLIYKSILAGKLRRYFSLRNLTDIFSLFIAFWQALFILLSFRPKLIISAGSFVSVPVVWAAKLLGIKILIHQQDIRPGLANKLMAPCASIITVAFEKNLADYGKKAIWIGNPVRKEFKKYKEEETRHGASPHDNLPTVLILGGGTGSETINSLIIKNLAELTKFCKIIHITGKHGIKPCLDNSLNKNYYSYDLLTAANTAEAMNKADLVIARAGLGTLTELAYLGKPAIIIPMPKTHQEDNANYFEKLKAIYLLNQENLTDEIFVKTIKDLILDKNKLQELSIEINLSMKKEANIAMLEVIEKLINKPD